jgi:hypothetical protein
MTINRGLGSGGPAPQVAEVVDLEQTAAAHARVEARAPGRTVAGVASDLVPAECQLWLTVTETLG